MKTKTNTQAAVIVQEEPDGGHFTPEALRHYRRIVDAAFVDGDSTVSVQIGEADWNHETVYLAFDAPGFTVDGGFIRVEHLIRIENLLTSARTEAERIGILSERELPVRKSEYPSYVPLGKRGTRKGARRAKA